jgi:3-hydroxyanthranilate 3,4-dioxygenase
VGLVIERARRPDEVDGMRWYTDDHRAVLYEEWFHCDDLGVQLVPVIARFKQSEACRTGVPTPGLPPPKVRRRLPSTTHHPPT